VFGLDAQIAAFASAAGHGLDADGTRS